MAIVAISMALSREDNRQVHNILVTYQLLYAVTEIILTGTCHILIAELVITHEHTTADTIKMVTSVRCQFKYHSWCRSLVM